MKPTITDVAARAQVSKATVSRVLNNRTNVREDIKNKVLQAIQELKYRPSGIARSLSIKKTNTIGLIIPDITNPFFPVLARGIEDAAHRFGYTVFLCNTDDQPDVAKGYIEKLEEQQVDGIILVSSNLQTKLTDGLSHNQTPFVICDRWGPDYPFDTIGVNNYKAAYEVVNHFIELGHQHILHLGGPSSVQSAEKRRQGYNDAMLAHELNPISKVGLFSVENGREQMKKILHNQQPTAIFAANDLIALGAIQAIHDHDLSVPKDIAVIGCDDIFAAQLSKPTLSTIVQPGYQMGITAMEMLDEQIKGVRKEHRHVVLKHRFEIRDSSGGRID